MPNIASVLKDEIARIARRELRPQAEALKKAVAHQRSEIAALKRRLAALERELAASGRRAARGLPAPADAAPAPRRFSAKGLRALRQRLGLSVVEMGALLGVSGQTIYNWEAASTRPREAQIAAIAALRGIGKREAAARLAAQAPAAPAGE